MEKYFKTLIKDKLKNTYPVYYGQIQIYMAKFKLVDNPALFSAINMNTMQIYWEEIPFSEDYAKGLDAKAVRILQACEAGELLPRHWQDPQFFKCKWCNYHSRCWEDD